MTARTLIAAGADLLAAARAPGLPADGPDEHP